MKNKTLNTLALLCLTLFSISTIAQDTNTERYTANNKGKFYVSWGGNRETFSKSDIRFEGEGYDFTIQDATAKDKPKGWHIDYINPASMTIPQTNFKAGYFISDKYNIALGVDHMKYVMNRNRTRTVNGYIDLPADEDGSIFNQEFNGDEYFLSEDFLKFEHTNGLNYVYLEINRFDDISSLFKINNTDIFQLNVTEGFGAGALYPKTNTTLLAKDRYDEFHLAGYGTHLNVGLNLTFYKYFFIQVDLKGGFINMPDIRTTSNANESASQHFWFLQRVISFGGRFRL